MDSVPDSPKPTNSPITSRFDGRSIQTLRAHKHTRNETAPTQRRACVRAKAVRVAGEHRAVVAPAVHRDEENVDNIGCSALAAGDNVPVRISGLGAHLAVRVHEQRGGEHVLARVDHLGDHLGDGVVLRRKVVGIKGVDAREKVLLVERQLVVHVVELEPSPLLFASGDLGFVAPPVDVLVVREVFILRAVPYQAIKGLPDTQPLEVDAAAERNQAGTRAQETHAARAQHTQQARARAHETQTQSIASRKECLM